MADCKFCAGCLRDNEENVAISWCSDCGELVCKHCGRAHARFASPHKVVPLEQAKKFNSSVLNLPKTCGQHVNQKLILFCCQHDQIICASCVPKNHQNCKSVISIEDAAKGVRSGAAVEDLERRLTNLCWVLDKLINESYDSDVDLQGKDIQKQISEIRKKINSHFDKIEDDLKREIESKRSECKQKGARIENELKMRVDNMRQWQKDIVSLKASGSEMHLFQAVKFLDIQTHKNEAEVRNIQQEGTQSLKFFPAENASKIENILLAFGTVRIVKNRRQSDHLELLKQGQQYLGTEKSKVITKSSSFRSSALGKNAKILSGCFAPGNKLFLCDHVGKCLYICKHDGSDSIKKTFKYELTQVTMYDANKALISMRQKGILLFDVSSLTCGKQISTSGCWDVASAGGIIWLRGYSSTNLSLIDINGKVVNEITTDFYIENICVSPVGENVYCSDGKNAVYIVTPTGRQTKLYESVNLKRASGLVADEKENVFVAGRESNNIHKISNDGKTAEVVLSAHDGLDSPEDLAYNISSKELLVVNDQMSVVIYKIQ